MTDSPNLFGIIGYVGEVSEPNGPKVVGYFLDEWAQHAQRRFAEWFAVEQERIRADERRRIADLIAQDRSSNDFMSRFLDEYAYEANRRAEDIVRKIAESPPQRPAIADPGILREVRSWAPQQPPQDAVGLFQQIKPNIPKENDDGD